MLERCIEDDEQVTGPVRRIVFLGLEEGLQQSQAIILHLPQQQAGSPILPEGDPLATKMGKPPFDRVQGHARFTR